MRIAFALATLAACTTAHQIADTTDVRLRAPGHASGLVVDHQRIDPNTELRFRDRDGHWTMGISGRSLYVDREGAWLDHVVTAWDVADAVRIEGLSEPAAQLIQATFPDEGGTVERDGNAWVLAAHRTALKRWLQELELGIARLGAIDEVDVPGESEPEHLQGDDAKLYVLEVQHMGAELGTWSFSSRGGAWQVPLRGAQLVEFLHAGRQLKMGWRWRDIAGIRVDNISGGMTLAGILVGLVSIPITSDSRAVERMNAQPPAETWAPELAPPESLGARKLFTTSATVHAIVRPIVAFDSTLALRGDLFSSGVSTRVRLYDVFELGGGVRLAETRGMTTTRQVTGMFQMGAHLPLDAAMHWAIPLGFEAGAGGHIDADVRFPWGLGYASGRWQVTALPATPQYLHVDGAPRRWSLASGVELGATF